MSHSKGAFTPESLGEVVLKEGKFPPLAQFVLDM